LQANIRIFRKLKNPKKPGRFKPTTFRLESSKLRIYEKELIFLSENNKSFNKKVKLLKKNIDMFQILVLIGGNCILKNE